MALLKDLIVEITKRNNEGKELPLLGVNKDKEFMPSVANVIGTDLSNYKIIKKRQFATNLMHVDRDELVPVSMLEDYDEALISPAYNVFQVKDEKIVIPEYLLLCFKRSEFDRCAWFYSGSSIRGNLDYKKFLEIDIPLPDIDKQKKIIYDYKAIQKEIRIKEAINNNLLEQCNVFFKEKIINQFKEQHNNGVWKSEELCDICTIKYGKGLSTEELLETGYPVYGGNGLIGYYSNYLYDDYKVIISCRGAASGKVQFSIPYSFVTSNSLVLNINKKQISFYYLLFMCQNIDFSIKVTGSAQPQLTVDNLNGIKIIIPDKQTYELVDNYLKKLFNSYVIYQKEIESLNKLQKILITKLAQQ